MYNVIQMTIPDKYEMKSMMESFQLGVGETMSSDQEIMESVFMEAVFEGGREKIQPIIDCFKKIKEKLVTEVKTQDEQIAEADKKAGGRRPMSQNSPRYRNVKFFDPKAFWRSQEFKDLEDQISEIFGFRDVSVEPYPEKRLSHEKSFETRVMNACVYNADRFPIDGLVTDKGFYDKTKSVRMMVYVSLGLLYALAPEEATAVLMHEFGHGIDPAMVTIHYTETNILSKYLTDRKGNLTKNEKKVAEDIGLFGTIASAVDGVKTAAKKKYKNVRGPITVILDWITKGKYSESVKKRLLKTVKRALDRDKSVFVRQNYSEAFADNFARMYGLGPQLISAIKKLSKDMDHRIRSTVAYESIRQEIIVNITLDMIQDCHKTDIHRAYALLREYKNDLKDPTIPEEVKKRLREDMDSLEKVLDSYMNDFDEMQNRINRLLNEELKKKYGAIEARDDKIRAENEAKEKAEKEEADKKSDSNSAESEDGQELDKPKSE